MQTRLSKKKDVVQTESSTKANTTHIKAQTQNHPQAKTGSKFRETVPTQENQIRTGRAKTRHTKL